MALQVCRVPYGVISSWPWRGVRFRETFQGCTKFGLKFGQCTVIAWSLSTACYFLEKFFGGSRALCQVHENVVRRARSFMRARTRTSVTS